MTKHLTQALLRPTDKLSYTGSGQATTSMLPSFPSGRYRDDYYLSGKFNRRLKVIGFTVNLEHCVGTLCTL